MPDTEDIIKKIEAALTERARQSAEPELLYRIPDECWYPLECFDEEAPFLN